jgi:hypothetical protein
MIETCEVLYESDEYEDEDEDEDKYEVRRTHDQNRKTSTRESNRREREVNKIVVL